MNYGSKNYDALDIYFDKKISNKELIPFMTAIYEETGISVATITRYAKRRGFYGFPDFRLHLNNQMNSDIKIKKEFTEEAIKFIDFLSNNEKIVIFTSMSTKPVGVFLLERLKTIKEEVTLVEDLMTFSTSEYGAIAITISNESARIAKFINNNKNFKETLLVSCSNTSSENSIVLKEFMYKERTNTNLFKSLKNINNWLLNVVDDYTEM